MRSFCCTALGRMCQFIVRRQLLKVLMKAWWSYQIKWFTCNPGQSTSLCRVLLWYLTYWSAPQFWVDEQNTSCLYNFSWIQFVSGWWLPNYRQSGVWSALQTFLLHPPAWTFPICKSREDFSARGCDVLLWWITLSWNEAISWRISSRDQFSEELKLNNFLLL